MERAFRRLEAHLVHPQRYIDCFFTVSFHSLSLSLTLFFSLCVCARNIPVKHATRGTLEKNVPICLIHCFKIHVKHCFRELFFEFNNGNKQMMKLILSTDGYFWFILMILWILVFLLIFLCIFPRKWLERFQGGKSRLIKFYLVWEFSKMEISWKIQS